MFSFFFLAYILAAVVELNSIYFFFFLINLILEYVSDSQKPLQKKKDEQKIYKNKADFNNTNYSYYYNKNKE